MIEGGARVISSYLHARKSNGEPVVDVVIVTVSPMVIGDGVSVLPEVDGRTSLADNLGRGKRFAKARRSSRGATWW